MENAKIIAELLGIKNPIFRESMYGGTEICWQENPTDEKLRIVTYMQGFFSSDWCYTKDISGLNGNWVDVMGQWEIYFQ